MPELNPSLQDLDLFLESGDFVEYQGSLYYVGTDPDSLLSQGYELEESDLEKTTGICSRRNVGTAPLESKPYVDGFNLQDKDSILFDGCRAIKEGEGVLPDSNFLILRKIKNPPDGYELSQPDHVIYNRDDHSYYCIKNGCTECIVTPHKVEARYSVTSADIAAQEPMVSTLVTREPKWVDVFKLRNFRYDSDGVDGVTGLPPVLQYMDLIAEEHLRISKTSDEYVLFVHNFYKEDRTDIYHLNYLVSKSKQDESVVPQLKDHIDKILLDFDGYYKTLSKGT